MSAPIVIDCGGSTRIKTILVGGAYGDMATLLDVHDLDPNVRNAVLQGTGPLPNNAVGSQHLAKGPFTNMSIVFQDAAGIPFMIPVNPLPPNFLIVSNLTQNVRGDFVPRLAGGGVDLIVTLYSDVADPLVEAKQHRVDGSRKGRRRYVVANAGPIRVISINDVAPAVLFDATNVDGPPPAPPVAPGAIGPAGGPAAPGPGAPLYVTVVLS